MEDNSLMRDMSDARVKRKMFAFDINPELHKLIKADAALRGISMTLWIEAVLVKEIERKKKYE